MSHDSAKHKQNGVNYIRSESSNRLVPVALYGQVIEWSQNRLYIMTRSHWVTGPESHYSDTRKVKRTETRDRICHDQYLGTNIYRSLASTMQTFYSKQSHHRIFISYLHKLINSEKDPDRFDVT